MKGFQQVFGFVLSSQGVTGSPGSPGPDGKTGPSVSSCSSIFHRVNRFPCRKHILKQNKLHFSRCPSWAKTCEMKAELCLTPHPHAVFSRVPPDKMVALAEPDLLGPEVSPESWDSPELREPQ